MCECDCVCVCVCVSVTVCVCVTPPQNLDVNQAVNNLLSRDDDDGEGGHEEGIVGFLPSGGEPPILIHSIRSRGRFGDFCLRIQA